MEQFRFLTSGPPWSQIRPLERQSSFIFRWERSGKSWSQNTTAHSHNLHFNRSVCLLRDFFLFQFLPYFLLLSSIDIRKKFWNRENFQILIFDGFTRFGELLTKRLFSFSFLTLFSFTLFYRHKKKILESWKLPNLDFWWIYTFWGIAYWETFFFFIYSLIFFYFLL